MVDQKQKAWNEWKETEIGGKKAAVIFQTQNSSRYSSHRFKKSSITDVTGLQNTQYTFSKPSQNLNGNAKWLKITSNCDEVKHSG